MSAAPSAYQPIGGPLRESDYQKFLLQSGIRREWIDRAGFTRVDDAEGREAAGQRSGNCAGILIPYFLPGEDQPREYCLRRDAPDIEYDTEGKPKERRKYLFPPGRGNKLYFPPGTSSQDVSDKILPLVITEGAKKTLALHQMA